MCENHSSTSSISSQQFIPFWLFPIEQTNNFEEPTNNFYQKCRILSYQNQVLKAVSLIFYIVYPTLSPSIYIAHEFDKNNSFKQRLLITNSQKTSVYKYHISNPHPYPINILIAKPTDQNNNTLEELKFPIYSVYHNRANSMYTKNYLYLNFKEMLYNIKQQNIVTTIHQTTEGIFLILPSNSKITIPAVTSKNFKICQSPHQWIGSFVQPVDLSIYQLISNNPNLTSLPGNIIRKLNTKNTDMITFPYKTNWFYKKNIKKTLSQFYF